MWQPLWAMMGWAELLFFGCVAGVLFVSVVAGVWSRVLPWSGLTRRGSENPPESGGEAAAESLGPADFPRRLIGCAFVFVATPVFLVGICFGVWSIGQSFNTKGGTGKVVELVSDFDSDGFSFRPVVEYEVDGKRYRIKGLVGFNPPVHEIGQTMRVLYKVEKPSEAYIDSIVDRWLFPLMFTFLGGLFLIFGFLMRRSATGDFAQ